MFKLKTVAFAAGLMALPAISQAAGPTLSDVLGNSGIAVSGAVDVSYDWADSDGVTAHAFDGGAADNTFALHQVNLLVTKTFGGGVSATVNTILGDDAAVTGADGDDFDIFQGYISYTNGGLTVSGGKFATLAGYEVVNSAGNANASRSFLFLVQPLAHTGVRASYKLNDTLALTAGLVNSLTVNPAGAGSRDNNSDKTIEAQIAFTPTKSLSVYLTGYKGNEDGGVGPGIGLDGGVINNDLIDLVASYTVNDMLSVALNADYLSIEDGTGGHNEAKGVAAYVTAKVLPKLSLSLRGESVVANAPGNDTTFNEGTLTAAYSVSDALSVLAEVRADSSSDDLVFFQHGLPGPGGNSNYQNTATIKAILKF